MNTLSWTKISEDPNQKFAFHEISAFMSAYAVQPRHRVDMAHLMIAAAMQIMDYKDPSDHFRDLNDDPDRAKKIRLANFMDFAHEFSGKRLALGVTDDIYLQKRVSRFKAAGQKMRMLEEFSEALSEKQNIDIDNLIHALDDMKDNMLMQGVPRLSLSKAFLDLAFVFASQANGDDYLAFCNYMNSALAPEQEDSLFDDEEMPEEALILLHMECASASIH